MYSWTKGYIMAIDSGDFIEFQWNPRKLIIHKDAKWNKLKVAGRDVPVQQFGCGQPRVVEFELEFSRSDNGDYFVQSQFDALLNLTYPIDTGGEGMKSPPKAILILGASLVMTGIVEDVKVEYESLSNKGKRDTYLADPATLLPKEGKVKVKFTEYL